MFVKKKSIRKYLFAVKVFAVTKDGRQTKDQLAGLISSARDVTFVESPLLTLWYLW